VALYQALAAVAGCAWNSWMRDLVPESDFGRFFGAVHRNDRARDRGRTTWRSADRWLEAPRAGESSNRLLALFVASAVFGFCGVWLLSITPEQPMPPVAQRTQIFTLLMTPFRIRISAG